MQASVEAVPRVPPAARVVPESACAAAAGCRLVTVERSLGSENTRVLRVRCAGGDDFGISSITLICAEIVINDAQTRQDEVWRHFYDGGFGRAECRHHRHCLRCRYCSPMPATGRPARGDRSVPHTQPAQWLRAQPFERASARRRTRHRMQLHDRRRSVAHRGRLSIAERPDRLPGAVSRQLARRRIARPMNAATRSQVRFYNRRHQPRPSHPPG